LESLPGKELAGWIACRAKSLPGEKLAGKRPCRGGNCQGQSDQKLRMGSNDYLEASDEKVFNMKIVRNVKTVNFPFRVIIIWCSMRPAKALQESDGPDSYMTESDSKLKRTPWSIQDVLIWKSDQHTDCWPHRSTQNWYLNHLHRKSYADFTAHASSKTEDWARFGLNPSWTRTRTLGRELT
jgi:hypothetical protein